MIKIQRSLLKIRRIWINRRHWCYNKRRREALYSNPRKKRWSKISLEWMAWGYGISLTPLQTLTFYNAVANNGVMVKPRFIKELRKEDKVEKVLKRSFKCKNSF